MANLWQPSIQRALDSNGNPVNGALMSFFLTGTSTPATFYLDADGSVPGANPVVSNSAGIFPALYLDPDTIYRVRLANASRIALRPDVDPVAGFDESQFAELGQQVIEAAEAAAASEAQTLIYRDETEAFRDEAALASDIAVGASVSNGFYPAARSFVPQGAVVASFVAGSGYTNGVYDITATGGDFSEKPVIRVTVAGGAITSAIIRLDAKNEPDAGLYIGASPTLPTVPLAAAGAGTGGSVTLAAATLVPVGGFYYTDHATDPSQVARFQNQAGAAVEVDANVDYLDIARAEAVAEAAELARDEAEAAGFVANAKSPSGWVSFEDNLGRQAIALQDDGSALIAALRRPSDDGQIDVYAELNALTRVSVLSANAVRLRNAINANAFTPQPIWRLHPDDVPTSITVSAQGASSGINGRITASPNVPLTQTARMQWLAGPSAIAGSSAIGFRGQYYGSRAIGGNYLAYEQMIDADDFEISVEETSSTPSDNLRVLIDDVIAGVVSVPNNGGGSRYVRFTLPTSRNRRIRVEGSGGRHYGINVLSIPSVTAVGREYPLVTVLGDSFVEGAGCAFYPDSEAIGAMRDLGFNVSPGGVGGTGLLVPGASPKVAWTNSNRINDLTLSGVTDFLTGEPSVPELGVIFLSINDNGVPASDFNGAATYQDAVTKALWALVDEWYTANPDKGLIIVGPTWVNDGPPMDIHRIRDAGEEVAWARHNQDCRFIDRLGPNPILRAGYGDYTSATGSISNGQVLITGLSSTANIGFQSGAIGTGIPLGARVLAVNSPSSVTLDLPATATNGAASLTFLNDQTAIYGGFPSDPTHPNPLGHTLDRHWLSGKIRDAIETFK